MEIVRDENLSTLDERNPLRILECFNGSPALLFLIQIENKDSPVGRLEERGDWVHKCWEQVLSKLPNVQGCRLMWTLLFFAHPIQSQQRVTEILTNILQELRIPDLQSLCVLYESLDESEDKLQVLNELQEEVSSKRNFWYDTKFKIKFLDGEIIAPKL
jgi:hypothetical protein